MIANDEAFELVKISDLDLHDVTPSQFTIDGEVEHCAVAQPTFAIAPEPDCPNLLRLQRPLGTNHTTHVPRTPIFGRRIILCVSHCLLLFISGRHRPEGEQGASRSTLGSRWPIAVPLLGERRATKPSFCTSVPCA